MSNIKDFNKWMNKTIQVLQVYSTDFGRKVHLGQLNYFKDKGYSEFQYSTEALDLKEEWSPFVLPLSKDVYRTSKQLPSYFDGLNGLFVDSLPDKWGTRLMDMAFHKLGIDVSQITPAVRLAFLGHRTIGSLIFEPSFGSLVPNDNNGFDLSDIAKNISSMEFTSLNEIPNHLLKGGSSAGGAHPKILVNASKDFKIIEPYDLERFDKALEPWLLKFKDKREHPDLLKVEYVYSEIAKSVGIDMSPCKLLYVHGDEPVFATKRFDVDDEGNRIFVHSLTGILEKPPVSSDLDYGHIANILKYFDVSMGEKEEMFKRCVFNAVMINRDDHGRNFAFMKDKNGKFKLTPAYDLTYAEGNFNTHALGTAGYRGSNPSYKDLVKLSKLFDISLNRTNELIEEVAEGSQKFKRLAKENNVDGDLVFWINENIKEVKTTLMRSVQRSYKKNGSTTMKKV